MIGLACGEKNHQNLTLKALESAIAMHGTSEGLIHHWDRAALTRRAAIVRVLDKHGIVCSMNRKGDCCNNGAAESFFETLKKELIYRHHFNTRAEAALARIRIRGSALQWDQAALEQWLLQPCQLS